MLGSLVLVKLEQRSHFEHFKVNQNWTSSPRAKLLLKVIFVLFCSSSHRCLLRYSTIKFEISHLGLLVNHLILASVAYTKSYLTSICYWWKSNCFPLILFQGRFEILSLSGSFMPTETGGTRSRSGGMSVSLASPDGRVVGGGVAGLLVAASPVQVRLFKIHICSSLFP